MLCVEEVTLSFTIDVSINLCRINGTMAQERLDVFNIDIFFQEKSGK